MKKIYRSGLFFVFLIILTLSGCISPKIRFGERVFEEKEISIPYAFNLSGDKKFTLLEIDVREVDHVVSKEEKWSWDEGSIPIYRIYYPREGFTFYIARIKVENTGGKILSFCTDLPSSFELTTNNNTYDAMDFYLLTEEKGYTCTESNDTEYEEEVCEYFSEDIYPGEIKEGRVFFEIRENEKPVELSFVVESTEYHVKIQSVNVSSSGSESF